MNEYPWSQLSALCLTISKDIHRTSLPSGHPQLAIENQLFERWHQVWTETFQNLGSNPRGFAHDFSRFSFVYCLLDKAHTIVAFLCSTIFDARSSAHKEHSYFKRYPKAFIQACEDEASPLLSSLEYCYVSPEWRKAQLPFSLVDILLCLCARRAYSWGIPRVIAVTRNDRSVNQVVYQRGGEAVVSNADLHNVKIDMISLQQSHFKFGTFPQDAWILSLEEGASSSLENSFVQPEGENHERGTRSTVSNYS